MSRSILWVNDFPPVTSGIATYFVNIWRYLPSDRVVVIAPKMPGTAEIDRSLPFTVQRLTFPLGETGRAKGLKTLLTVIYCFMISLTQRPSRHHCGQVLSSGIAGLICKKLLRIPYVVYVYGSETIRLGTSGLSRWLMRTILCESDWVIANSAYTAEEFRTFGVDEDRLRVIYPGVDPERFRPADPDGPLIERYGLEGKRVLLTVARLDERKGHDTVIHALASLMEDIPDLVYLIAGKGREEARLRQLSIDMGVGERVLFAGYVPDEDLPDYYNLCDIFVMPNRVTTDTVLAGDIEGFGITFVEAGACGKPVIAGRSGGAVEAVVDGETGLLVDSRSPEAVAEAIRCLLQDRTLADRLGEAGRRRIEAVYDWRLLAKQVEEIL